LLKNKKYIGIYEYADKEYKGFVEPIIDEKTFADVQAILAINTKARARKKAKEEYLLTFKLFCGFCKEMMIGISGTSNYKNTPHFYYVCKGNIHKNGCGKKYVKKDWIENLVIKHCKGLLTDENINLIAAAVVKAAKQSGDNLIFENLQKHLKQFEREQENLTQAIAECPTELVRKSLYQKLNITIESKQELETQLAIEGNRLAAKITVPQVKYFLSRLRTGNTSELRLRKALINTFVEAVYVYDEPGGNKKITYIFNIGENKQEITESVLTEVESVANRSYIDCTGSPKCSYPNTVKSLLKSFIASSTVIFSLSPSFPPSFML